MLSNSSSSRPVATATALHNSSRRNGLPRLFLPAALLMLTALLLLVPTGSNTAHAQQTSTTAGTATAKAATTTPVRVTLYVMSQCPDAKFCQRALKPVMETLPSVATLSTEYIATLKGEDKVQCMHGDAECAGNRQQLCLQHHLPAASDNRLFVKALLCHGGGVVSDVAHLQSCMTSAAVSASVQADVLKCVDGTLGGQLQAKSAQAVVANSVKKSCTVFVDGKKRCIRDGGRWYDCEGGSDTAAFIKTICDAHTAKAAGKVAAECRAALGQAGASNAASSSSNTAA